MISKDKDCSLKLYTLAFENEIDDKRYVISGGVSNFLNQLEKMIEAKVLPGANTVNDKEVKIFKYNHSSHEPNNIFTIPFGVPKEGVIYKSDEINNFEVTEVTDDLYNINLLYYNDEHQIALLTSFKEGPSAKKIEAFLNYYIPTNCNYKLKLRPIIKTTSLDDIKKFAEIRSVTISFDLGEDINSYFNSAMHKAPIFDDMISSIAGVTNNSYNTLDNQVVKLTFGLGRERNRTMNIQNVYELLNSLNINNDCVTEIEISHKSNQKSKLDKSYLKKTDIVLKSTVKYGKSRSLIYSLMNEAPNILDERDDIIQNHTFEYFYESENSIQIEPTYPFNLEVNHSEVLLP